jgi:predicted RNase H-like HicB family nuclease
MQYAVVIEKAATNYSGYVPDLPGCVASGTTPAAVRRAIKTAIEMHLTGLREDGQAVPKPSARVAQVALSPGRTPTRRKKSAA